MNRDKFYKLRHDIRSSGMSWNWGRRVGKDLEWIKATILHPSYDKFEPLSGTLVEVYKRRAKGVGRIQIKNWIRSNVRRDNRVFTEQLTNY